MDDLKILDSIEELDWQGFDVNLMSAFFEKLEIRALKDRIKSLPQVGAAQIQEIKISVKEITHEELSSKLKNHNKPIAISFKLLEGQLQGYAVALNAIEVLNVSSSKVGAVSYTHLTLPTNREV